MSSRFSAPRFSEVVLPNSNLRMHLMSCPGVRFAAGEAIAADRFLLEDLGRLETQDTRMVLSCLCQAELTLGVDRYAKEYKRRGVAWHVVPIADMSAPSPEQDIALDRVFSTAEPLLATGGRIAIHCLAGLGRTGTVAARLAMKYGLTAAQAIAFIRAGHDSKAIETPEQETYLLTRDALAYR